MKYDNIQKIICLLLIPIINITALLLHFLYNEFFIKSYFLSITVVISFSILFYYFPIFIKILHTKPVYYEDIILIKQNNINQYQLQNIFLVLNGISSVIFILIISNYI